MGDLEELEVWRRDALRIRWILIGITIGTLGLAFGCLWLIDRGVDALPIGTLLFLVAVISVVLQSVCQKKDYIPLNEAYTEYWGGLGMKHLRSCPRLSALTFREKDGISQEVLRTAAALRCGERNFFQSWLLVQGKYGPLSFSRCRVRSEMICFQLRRNWDGTSSSRVPIFDGIVFRIKRESPSSLWLQIFQREGLFCPLLGRAAPRRMKTGHRAFDRRFVVRTSDREAARQVLTEEWMETLLDLSRDIGHPLAVTFHDRSLYVAIQGLGNLWLGVPVARQAAWAKGESDWLCRFCGLFQAARLPSSLPC